MLNKLSAVSVLLLTAATSFSALATVDNQSTTNNVDNTSEQNSTGVVSNNPTFVNNGAETPYGRIGKVSCAQPSINVGAASSGDDYFDSGAVYINFNMPLGGKSCDDAMAEAEAQMRKDTQMTLELHCASLMERGIAFTNGAAARECKGFEYTELGNNIIEARTAEVKAASEKALNDELEQFMRRMDICQAYAERGVLPTQCKGVPLPASFMK